MSAPTLMPAHQRDNIRARMTALHTAHFGSVTTPHHVSMTNRDNMLACQHTLHVSMTECLQVGVTMTAVTERQLLERRPTEGPY